jgi:two-component system sensor histidine kinase YesM
MKWFNRLVFHFLHNTSLKSKLLISYSILIIIPLVMLSMYAYNKITDIIHDRAIYSAEQNFDQTHSYLSYKLYKIIRTSDLIATDKNVREILDKTSSVTPLEQQVEDMIYMVRYLTSLKDDVDIQQVKLYVNPGMVYSDENRNIFNLRVAEEHDWFQRLMASQDKVTGFPSAYFEYENNAVEIVSLARKISRETNYRENVGLLRLDIEQSKLDNILVNANATKSSFTYLRNAEGLIVATSDKQALSDIRLMNELAAKEVAEERGFASAELNERKVIYESRLIPYTDWSMVTVIPEKSIVSELGRLRVEFIVLIVVLGTLAYACGYYISVSITRRVSRLTTRMKRVQSGELDSIIRHQDKDEIGELIDNFNYMLSRISTLGEEQYQMGLDLKTAELRALQSQINPHFLYNTLDLINWLSQKNMVSEISEVTIALANFYKFSLNKGRDISTIDYELRHISSYVHIQNIRFRNKIHLELDVDELALHFTIPKITLQPIVENAIHHGILEKPEKEGTIGIRVWQEPGHVVLCISDDGVGIPSHRLELIEKGIPISNRGNHYAIRNINERLRLVYGESYKLDYQSTLGEGTKVYIRIPANDPE